MREVDKNNAIKSMSDPPRAAARQYEAAAVAGCRKGEGLYFPVNLDDEATVAGMDPAADGDDPERGACISLLIPETRAPLPAAQRMSRRAQACISLLIRWTSRVGGDADACRSLLIPNSGRSSPFAERGRLLRERAATA
jgi:hypothetical protein